MSSLALPVSVCPLGLYVCAHPCWFVCFVFYMGSGDSKLCSLCLQSKHYLMRHLPVPNFFFYLKYLAQYICACNFWKCVVKSRDSNLWSLLVKVGVLALERKVAAFSLILFTMWLNPVQSRIERRELNHFLRRACLGVSHQPLACWVLFFFCCCFLSVPGLEGLGGSDRPEVSLGHLFWASC